MSFYNKSFFSGWWRNIDRYTLFAIIVLAVVSAVMIATASPAIADRLGLNSSYFINRQIIYLFLALIVIFLLSCSSIQMLKDIAIIGFIVCLFMLVLVLFMGVEIKGSRRWIQLWGISIQPSEFIKPFFSVVIGSILSKQSESSKNFLIAVLLYAIVITLMILQPDFGMVVTISTVWGGQLFLAGLHLFWILTSIIIAAFGITGAYMFLPHVTKRINDFIDPIASENYQIKKSLDAFANGGFYGRGPGEGIVKQSLPDSHTDFIFSVVGEELGIVFCLLILLVFSFIVIRGFIRILSESDPFVFLATTGLFMQFGMQSIINMGVTLNLFPTKGMTLPFISYGGSSMIAIAICMGMILAMTKKRIEIDRFKFNFKKRF